VSNSFPGTSFPSLQWGHKSKFIGRHARLLVNYIWKIVYALNNYLFILPLLLTRFIIRRTEIHSLVHYDLLSFL
jgi:hypothetical protein